MSFLAMFVPYIKPSPPSRGAWIEIYNIGNINGSRSTSPPSRGAWIEICRGDPWRRRHWSPPSRGAWIEIDRKNAENMLKMVVAPLAGGVD